MKIKTLLLCFLFLCNMSLGAYGAEFNKWYADMTGFNKTNRTLVPVRIALIDTGVDTKRLDGSRILTGKNYVSDTKGDLIGHGTHIASLIIGYDGGKDSIPILAPNASIIPLIYQSVGANGIRENGGVEALCQGIYDAVDVYGAQIIVISSGVKADYETLREAVEYAEEKGVIFISAAGNSGSEMFYYPAAYDSVISVGAVDESRNPTSFTMRNGSVTVVAPGKDLLAVSLDENYPFDIVSGTSYSCAYVAAMAAQLKGAYPDMTPDTFRRVLQLTSTDLLESGYDDATGYGLLNASRAMEQYPQIAAMHFFEDVQGRDWFFDAVSYVSNNGLMSGVTEALFAPGESVTRAMLVTVLHRAEGEPETEQEAGFFDVPAGAYYEKAVSWAKANGIVSGISKTEFSPNASITREQIAAIMHRYAVYKGYDVSACENTNILSYDDFSEISEYAIPAMQYVAGSGLISGKTESTLNPKDKATRAEIATILKRFLS